MAEEQAPGTSPKATAAERRVVLRHKPAINTVCQFDGARGETQAPAIVWNISTTGICLLAPEPRKVGTVLAGYLGTTDGNRTRRIVLRIVHCRKVESGDYALGARFERPLNDDELKPFVLEK